MSQSLERGLKALLFLASRKSTGVTELAEELQVNKSTAFRILEELQKHNMAEQNKATSKYKLGPAILKLSEQLNKSLNIISVAKPYMVRLMDITGESVHLCTLANDSAVIIEQIMANSRLSVNAKIGSKEPLYSSSVGKCLLAFGNEEAREKMLSGIVYEKFTEKTIATEEKLREELLTIKNNGYALDDGELSEEIKCLAAPVFNHLGEAIYSLGLSAPASRMTAEKILTTAEHIKNTAMKISQHMGYSI